MSKGVSRQTSLLVGHLAALRPKGAGKNLVPAIEKTSAEPDHTPMLKQVLALSDCAFCACSPVRRLKLIQRRLQHKLDGVALVRHCSRQQHPAPHPALPWLRAKKSDTVRPSEALALVLAPSCKSWRAAAACLLRTAQ